MASITSGGMGRAGVVEVVHVHPYFDFQFYKDESHKGAVTNPLSESDLAHAQSLSIAAAGTYVRYRAVLPSGYSYSATFLNGRRVVDPIYSLSQQGRATKLFYFKKRYPKISISPELENKIAIAQTTTELKKWAVAAESNSSPVERILAAALVARNDENYEPFKLAVQGLLAKGLPEKQIIEEISHQSIQINMMKILEDAEIALHDKDYFEFATMVESQLRSGNTRDRVLALVQETKVAIKNFEHHDLPATPEVHENSCKQIFL